MSKPTIQQRMLDYFKARPHARVYMHELADALQLTTTQASGAANLLAMKGCVRRVNLSGGKAKGVVYIYDPTPPAAPPVAPEPEQLQLPLGVPDALSELGAAIEILQSAISRLESLMNTTS